MEVNSDIISNRTQMMNYFKQATLLFSLLAAQHHDVMAFSPCSSSPIANDAHTPTRLGYRNYYDILTEMSTPKAAASSPTVTVQRQQRKVPKHGSKSVIPPKLCDEVAFTPLDVDADRMPLSILLEPPAAPITKRKDQEQQQEESPLNIPSSRHTSHRVTSTASRAATRSSPITQLFSIQDYKDHVLNSSPNQLCIIRFHAPWCQVCRTTNVSWERMASKIVKMNSSTRKVKFLSVSIDGKNEEAAKLKDMLSVEGVPQGIINHVSDGVFGQKVVLNRKNLGVLKKQLESYLTNDMGADLFLYRLKKDI